MVIEWCIMLAMSAVRVALRAFQQLNVVHDNRWLVPPVSFGMAATEVVAIGMAINNWWLIIPMGIGGSAGCIFSMELHKRMRQRGKDKEQAACRGNEQKDNQSGVRMYVPGSSTGSAKT